jgi:hypothetical protein
MQTVRESSARGWLNTTAAVFIALGFLTASTGDEARPDHFRGNRSRMKMQAGTVFNLNAGPTYPWSHQVRGLAEVSKLGNCKVFFDVLINAGVATWKFDGVLILPCHKK